MKWLGPNPTFVVDAAQRFDERLAHLVVSDWTAGVERAIVAVHRQDDP